MGETCINQSTSSGVMNIKRILNDSGHHHSTKLVMVEDSSSSNGPSNIPRILRTVRHEVLCTLTLVTDIIQLVARSVTVVLTIMMNCRSRQRRITYRWRWGSNYCRSCSRSLISTTLVSLLPFLLRLHPDILDVLVVGNKKFLNQLGLLEGCSICVRIHHGHSIKYASPNILKKLSTLLT